MYICGRTYSQGVGNGDALIAKYNTSGTIQWQRSLGSSSDDIGSGIALDTSGNIYICGYTAGTSFIAKYNSSGDLQWQQQLTGAGNYLYSVATDPSGDVYTCGYIDLPPSQYGGLIVKYNSSGVLQWQRVLTHGAGQEELYNVTVNGSGSMTVTGYATTNYVGLIARLPSDGSLTGTYGPFTYAASSLTNSASMRTSAATTLTNATTTLTNATTTLTDAASSFISTVTYL